MSVQAIKRGAIEFLTKPCRDEDLIERSASGSLAIVQGRLSKPIAHDIGTSKAAVNFHRSNLMPKLNIRSLPKLCRMADKLNLLSEMR